MNKPIKISIITVSYNSEKTIEQTILSIINQTYKNIEYIIVDGESTDNTINIVKKYADKISYWISEPDTGIYDAMNKGCRIATGDYVEIIGSDDCLSGKNVIKNVVSSMNQDTDIWSGCEYLVNDQLKRQILYSNNFARDQRRYKGGMIPHAGMFVRRELLQRYAFDTHYQIASDYKFFLQTYYDPKIKFQFSDMVVAFFSTGGISNSNQSSDLCEGPKIENELHVSFLKKNNVLIKLLKMILIKLNLLYLILFIKFFIQSEKHYCDNPKCRWCNRT